MAKELVLCYCCHCYIYTCTTLNSWTRISSGKSIGFDGPFFIPEAIKLHASPGLVAAGHRRPATEALEGCVFQNLVCIECAEVLGWTCVEANEEKRQVR